MSNLVPRSESRSWGGKYRSTDVVDIPASCTHYFSHISSGWDTTYHLRPDQQFRSSTSISTTILIIPVVLRWLRKALISLGVLQVLDIFSLAYLFRHDLMLSFFLLDPFRSYNTLIRSSQLPLLLHPDGQDLKRPTRSTVIEPQTLVKTGVLPL
jgi:hypothetical protein